MGHSSVKIIFGLQIQTTTRTTDTTTADLRLHGGIDSTNESKQRPSVIVFIHCPCNQINSVKVHGGWNLSLSTADFERI